MDDDCGSMHTRDDFAPLNKSSGANSKQYTLMTSHVH
jgi:hypothetical protein